MSMLEWAKNEIAIASKRERGDKVEINRYFKESEISFTEISSEEYKERQRLHENRIKAEGETDI